MMQNQGHKMENLKFIPILSFSFVVFCANLGLLTLPFLIISELSQPKVIILWSRLTQGWGSPVQFFSKDWLFSFWTELSLKLTQGWPLWKCGIYTVSNHAFCGQTWKLTLGLTLSLTLSLTLIFFVDKRLHFDAVYEFLLEFDVSHVESKFKVNFVSKNSLRFNFTFSFFQFFFNRTEFTEWLLFSPSIR